MTSSITDHFIQFSITDIFQASGFKRLKFAREFNKHEFGEELVSVDFSDANDESSCAETSYNNFFRKIKVIMDYMAPYRKITPKEIKLEQMPWVTYVGFYFLRV